MADYDEMISKIKVFLTDTINDIMLLEAGKGYIRITKEDMMRYAHMSIIIGKFYYLEDLQKIYFYFSFDQNVKWALSDFTKFYYKSVMDSLYQTCRVEINCTISLLGPSYLVENTQCAKGSNVTRFITPYTIGYWKGTNKQYEFINDPEMIMLDKYRYDTTHGLLDTNRNTRTYLKQLKEVRDNLNKNNDMVTHPELIPEVFNLYRNSYRSIMGNEYLPAYDIEEDANTIYLLNATDFFGGDYYY